MTGSDLWFWFERDIVLDYGKLDFNFNFPKCRSNKKQTGRVHIYDYQRINYAFLGLSYYSLADDTPMRDGDIRWITF